MDENNNANNFEDRRADKRTSDISVLSLKIVFASETPGLLGKNLSGQTIDVSASGLGVSLNCEVPLKSNLDFWVTLNGDFKKYFLSGKVQWCKPSSEEGMYSVGIPLHERTDTATDLDSWSKDLGL